MSGFEVPAPILNGRFDEPGRHWHLEPGEPPEQRQGRRTAGYYYRDPRGGVQDGGGSRGVWQEMPLANLIRARVREWHAAGRPGHHPHHGGADRLVGARGPVAAPVLRPARGGGDGDLSRRGAGCFRQGIEIPADPPSAERLAEEFAAFPRQCAKMTTGTGKSTVAAMIAAWSILNKVADRGDPRFSDTVLIVCPNVTIRSRLGELDPATGDASLYRTRDLVPEAMMPDLAHGRMIITNWHVLEPQSPGAGSRVEKRGVARITTEEIIIGGKHTTMRGNRYYTLEAYEAAVAAGVLAVIREETDATGIVVKAVVRATCHVESDAALVARVLGRAGGRQNILVINDEAHHAYRIAPDMPGEDQGALDFDEEDSDEEEIDRKEATVWMEGLDRIHKMRGINLCIDLSATPYFLGRMGSTTNTVFPWVVSDFGLTDAIEPGLVKVPQLVAADDTGRPMPAYFNIWEWIKPNLTASERGTARGSPKAEAILKWAHTPIAMLVGMWSQDLRKWAAEGDPRPPVFILVAKNKRIARSLFEWIGEGRNPPGVVPLNVPALANGEGPDGDHPRRYRGGGGDRFRQRQERREPLDAADPRYCRQRHLAGGPAGTAGLSGRVCRAGGEARLSAASAGAGCAVHRLGRDADRGLGLQHGDACDRAAAVPEPASVRAGGGEGITAALLPDRRGREIRGGGCQGIRRPIRSDPVQGEQRQPETEAAAASGLSGAWQGAARHHHTECARLSDGNPQPHHGRGLAVGAGHCA